MTVKTTHTLTIPDWLPSRLNQLMGCHYLTGHRRKKADKQIVAAYAYSAGIPKAVGKRRVTLHLTMAPRMRRPDVDAHWKSVLDALVACELLVDDNPVWCELAPVEYNRGAKRLTTITLEDLEDAPS